MLNGAWLLGADAVGRHEAWHTLHKTYKTASALVHGGRVRKKEDAVTLLKAAQELCRKGILRVLDEGPVTDWQSLILDAQGI